MTIPPDFALTHITVNTGHSFHKEVFEDKRPQAIANVARHFQSLLQTGTSPVLNSIHAKMIDVAPHDGPCAGWYLHPAEDPRMAMVTCFASLAPNAALFASAVELARGQFSSFAEVVSERLAANPAALDDSFLAPHGVIAAPEPPWLATVLHLPFFRCPREYIPMVADLNQCLAATALHQP